jgi:uncharacterized membrane protein
MTGARIVKTQNQSSTNLKPGRLFRLRLESLYMLVVALLVGALAIIIVPPVSTFDAPGHYFRSEVISRGHFRPIQYSERQMGSDIPARHTRFVNTLWFHYWNLKRLGTLRDWVDIAKFQPGDDKRVRQELTNIAVYSPANYIPQGIALWANRILGGSPLGGSRAACTLNLLLYIALVVFALQKVPRFQRGLLLIATSPFLLIQASTLSSDGINFAVPLCVFALVWKMRADPDVTQVNMNLAALVGLAVWTALLKPTQIICLAILLFVPESYFHSRREKALWLIATFSIAASLWSYWNTPYLDVNIAGWYDPTHPAVANQKAWLLSHPQDLLNAIKAFFSSDAFPQLRNSYGGVGGWIPAWVASALNSLSYVYVVVLGLEACRNLCPDRIWGLITLTLSLALLLFMAVTLWICYGVRNTDHIPYLGGRYLFLVIALAFLGFSELLGQRIPIRGRYTLAAGLATNLAGLSLILIPTALKVLPW